MELIYEIRLAAASLCLFQITNNLKQICKMNKRKIQITDAKVR